MRRLVSCLAVLVLCTCVPTESGSDDRPLTIHLQTSERAFFHCGNMPQRLLLFDPLIGRGETGELEGRLAESWEASDDFLTWTVRLDPEARWHDGEPVTVRDIEFTLRLVSDPDIGYLRAESYTFETIDEHTYRIRHHPGPSRLPHIAGCEPNRRSWWNWRPIRTITAHFLPSREYSSAWAATRSRNCWQATPTRRSASSPRKRFV
jgi:hypothetical protein